MENLKRDYPNLFKVKEVIVTPKQRNRTVWRDNTPIITDHGSHYEVRKLEHSSPIILSKQYDINN